MVPLKGLNKIMHGKHIVKCLAWSKYPVTVSCHRNRQQRMLSEAGEGRPGAAFSASMASGAKTSLNPLTLRVSRQRTLKWGWKGRMLG